MRGSRVTAVTNATTANAGQPFTVSWTVANQGAGPTVEASWTDRIYLSETPTLNLSAALLVAEYQRSSPLGQNETYSRTENPVTPTRAQGQTVVRVVKALTAVGLHDEARAVAAETVLASPVTLRK